MIAVTAEIARRTQNVELAGDVLPALRALDQLGVVLSPGWPLFVPGLLVELAVLTGETDLDRLRQQCSTIAITTAIPRFLLD